MKVEAYFCVSRLEKKPFFVSKFTSKLDNLNASGYQIVCSSPFTCKGGEKMTALEVKNSRAAEGKFDALGDFS